MFGINLEKRWRRSSSRFIKNAALPILPCLLIPLLIVCYPVFACDNKTSVSESLKDTDRLPFIDVAGTSPPFDSPCSAAPYRPIVLSVSRGSRPSFFNSTIPSAAARRASSLFLRSRSVTFGLLLPLNTLTFFFISAITLLSPCVYTFLLPCAA